MGFFKRSGDDKGNSAAPNVATVEPRHVTASEFDKVVLGSEMPTVVDFWAEWCGPCHAIAPAVQQLATEFDGRALVVKLNADESPDVIVRYGIMGIPTLIYFKGGQEVDRVVGLAGYSKLKSKLEGILA